MESIVPLFLVILGAVVLGYAVFGLKSKNNSVQVVPTKTEPVSTNNNPITKSMDENTRAAVVIPPVQPIPNTGGFGVWTGFKLGFGFTLGAFIATLLIMLVFGFVFAGAIASLAATFLGGFPF